MAPQLLLVENDLNLQQTLQARLAHIGHCSVASSLKEAYKLLEEMQFDLIILDRILDDGDALELLPFLGEVSFATRTLLLTTRNSQKDTELGLSAGADDYLGKPFSWQELKLRISHLLSIKKIKQATSVQFGTITLYPSQGLVIAQSEHIALRKREMQILTCLSLYQNQVVSREVIISHVWSGQSQIPQHDSLDVYIRRIRVKVPQIRPYLKTIRGFGYRLNVR